MENNKPIFAVDVDAVLRDNIGMMVDLYNKEFNDTMKVDDVKQYKTELSFPRIEAESGITAQHWFFQDHSQELFLDAKPFPNVAEDIKRLRQYGSVVIVTYQKTIKNKAQTLEWLEKNGIEYDSIIFTKDKSIVRCDFFIDDNDWNFIGNNARVGFLVDAPYNMDVQIDELCEKSNCQKMYRCESFHSFVDTIEQKFSHSIKI